MAIRNVTGDPELHAFEQGTAIAILGDNALVDDRRGHFVGPLTSHKLENQEGLKFDQQCDAMLCVVEGCEDANM